MEATLEVQQTLDDSLFGKFQSPQVQVNLSGNINIFPSQLQELFQNLAPGIRFDLAVQGYVCGAGLKWKPGGASKDGALNIRITDLLGVEVVEEPEVIEGDEDDTD